MNRKKIVFALLLVSFLTGCAETITKNIESNPVYKNEAGLKTLPSVPN